MVAALGAEESTALELSLDSLAIAVRIANCSPAMHCLLVCMQHQLEGLGVPLFWPLYERRKKASSTYAPPDSCPG